MRTALRKKSVFAAAAVAALAFSLTACNDGSGTEDSGAAASASSSASAESSPGADSTEGKPAAEGDQNQSGSAGGSDTSGGSDSAAPAEGSGTGEDTGAHGECVNTGGADGCYEGKLSYLADHKMMVDNQAFDVADSTRILGAAAICGPSDGSVSTDDNNTGTTPCTYDQLVQAAKMGTVKVRVNKDSEGVAATVAEIYHP
ncbi:MULTISPECIES: hypothetical protein [unclassified Streptomyces]|uniref:hypothetical protein n=1 Tax=unclassified Streptomyces TaxID=2593676 RepID=UPI00278C5223|nr:MULTISPECIES: hypothetical protein [unclassified Streptomyces]